MIFGDPSAILQGALETIAEVFPDHGITLVLRGSGATDFAILTTDKSPALAHRLLGGWISDNIKGGCVQ